MTISRNKVKIIVILAMIVALIGAMTILSKATDVSSFNKIDKQQTTYELPGDTDFAIIKQGSGNVIAWTKDAVTASQKADIKEAASQDGSIGSSTFHWVTGFDIFKAADLGISGNNWGAYGFATSGGKIIVSIYNADGKTLNSGRISHIDYGTFKKTETGMITLRKSVVNGDGVTGTFYFKLLNSSSVQVGDLKSITIADGVMTSATVTWTDLPYGDYTIIETDENGTALNKGDKSFGKELVDISSDNNTKVTLEAVASAADNTSSSTADLDSIAWTDGSSSNLFGSASNINLLAFGDVKNIKDVEGNVAVAGNFTNSGGFSAGSGNSTTGTRSYSDDTALLVKGNASAQQINTKGHVAIGGTYSLGSVGGSDYSVGTKYTSAVLQSLYGTDAEIQNHTNSFIIRSDKSAVRVQPSSSELSTYFSNAKSYMESLQDQLASLDATGTVTYDTYSTVLTGNTSKSLNVFTVDASKMSTSAAMQINNCSSSSAIIVNIIGANSGSTVKTGNPAWGSETLRQHTIFNFVDAAAIQMNGSTAFYGSVLAPDANFDVNGQNGNINGNAVVNNLTNTDSGFECHQYYFNLKLSTEAKAEITNTFKDTPASVQFGLTKRMSGREFKSGDAYTFNLYKGTDTSGTPIDTVTTTKTSGTSQDLNFKSISYDSAGTYTYTIKEVKGGTTDKGLTYSDKTYKVTVTVVKDSSGKLQASYVINDGDSTVDSATFTNKYEAQGTAKITVGKQLTGKTLQAGDFNFRLVRIDAEGHEVSGTEMTAANKADGTVDFSGIEYKLADAGKTYTYKITEVLPEGVTATNNVKGNMTYDTNAVYVKVTVGADNGDGTLEASTYEYPPTGVVFTNQYGADGNAVLKAKKTLSHKDLSAGEFSFAVYSNALCTGTPIATASNTAGGAITFDPITYKLSDLGNNESKTFTYYIKESASILSADKGISIDSTVYKAEVTVTNDGSHELKTTVAYYNKDGSKMTGTDVPTFENVYSATGSVDLKASKVLKGQALTAGEFTFTAVAVDKDGNTLTGNKAWSSTKTNDGSGNVDFGTIRYSLDDLGTHYYKITETRGTAGGVTYDGKTIVIKIEVTDMGDGTLNAAKSILSGTDTTFTNEYGVEGNVQLEAKKILVNKILKAGGYSFTAVEVANEDGDALSGDDVWTRTALNDLEGKVHFEQITYTKAGTHYYKITENLPAGVDENGIKDGVHYSTDSVIVKVVAADKGDGTLDITKSVVGDTNETVAKFTNTYNAEGDVTLSAHKTLNGKSLTNGEFTFNAVEVADKNGTAINGRTAWSDTAVNNGDGDVAFETIEYKVSDIGVHYYKITETEGTAGGVTYDGKTVIVKVTVADNGDGTLEVDKEVVSGTDTTFTNSYNASGSVTLDAQKTLSGRALKNGEFTFKAEAVDENGKSLTGNDAWNDTAVNDGSNVTFDTIDYTQADEGDHYYKITESKGIAGGVTYDGKTVIVKVTVADNGDGTLAVDKAVVSGTDTTFTNSYKAEGDVALNAHKNLSGKSLTEGEFTFNAVEVADENGAAITGRTAWSDTAVNNGDGDVTFETIGYKLADIGDHYYKITEAKGTAGGITYDGKTVIVKVTVADKGDGTLSVEKDVVKGTDTTFTNSYSAKGGIQLEAQKTLTGRDINENEFTFTAAEVADANGTAITGRTAWTASAKNDVNGNVTFEKINYTLADLGDHYYKITETQGSLGGVTYDSSSKIVKVTVKDDVKDGDLEISKSIVGNSDAAGVAKFENTYAAEGYASISVKKSLVGKDLTANEFTFELTQVDANGKPVEGFNKMTAVNDADGNVDFSKINYGLSDAGNTYYYQIKEKVPADAKEGVYKNTTYSDQVITVSVEVGTDNGDGTLTDSKITYPAAGKEFTNTYGADGSIDLTASKELTGRDLKAGDFSFGVYPEGSTTAAATAQNKADGTIAFSKINYTLADLNGADSKTFTYDIKEAGSLLQANKGVTMDTTIYKAKVTVTNDGSRELKTAVKYYKPDGTTELTGTAGPTFSNVYNAKGSVSFAAHKTLTGGTLTAGQFTFGLYDADGNAVKDADGNAVTATNDADGTVTFDNAVQYELKDLGEETSKTFTYRIKEIVPTDEGNITYDATEYTAAVDVTDQGDGTLSTAVKYTLTGSDAAVDTPEFTNMANIGRVTVTKNTLTATGELYPVNATFYVALFDSNDDATANRISDVRAIAMNGASSQTVTFENLKLGTQYVVKETDSSGNIITSPTNQGITNWVGLDLQNNVVTPTVDVPEGTSVVNNYFDTTEEYNGSIDVTKTVKVNGKAKASNQTFYTALFSNADCTDRVTEVKALKMNGNSSTTVSFSTDLNGNYLKAGENNIYYVAETTSTGKAITDGQATLGCTITQDSKTVYIDPESTKGKASITNSYKDQEEYYKKGGSTTTTATTTGYTKTGDDSNMPIWMLLAALGLAGAVGAGAARRKNGRED